ncbi:ThaI family type II restriction endonuclease [Candidatus Hakubella thermalkaliphila]
MWTVDAQKAKEFRETYYPRCEILLVQINWNGVGGFYSIPLEVQKRLFDKIGRQNYINPTAILKNLGSICRAISLIEPQHIVCIQVNDVVGLSFLNQGQIRGALKLLKKHYGV